MVGDIPKLQSPLALQQNVASRNTHPILAPSRCHGGKVTAGYPRGRDHACTIWEYPAGSNAVSARDFSVIDGLNKP